MEHYTLYAKNLFLKVFVNDFWEKMLISVTGFLAYLVSEISFFISPLIGFFFLVLGVLMADLFFAFMILNKQKKTIDKVKLMDSVFKLCAYCVALMICRLTQVVMMPNVPIPYFTMVFILYPEYKSLNKNVKSISGYSIFDFIINRFETIIKTIKK